MEATATVTPSPTAEALTSPTFDTPPGVYTGITVGERHACALTKDGEAVCWDVAGGARWDTPPGSYTFITAEDSTTCAITEDGEIVCWGWGGEVRPEYGSDPSRDAPTERYTALTMIGDYTCALTDEGAVVCWGSEDQWPALPDPPPGRYTAISGRYYNSGYGGEFETMCALSDSGDIVCWQGTNTNTEEYVRRYSGDYRTVNVWRAGFCALTADGEATSGNHGYLSGDCGLASHDGSVRYTALAVGRGYNCAITDSGTAVCAEDDRWQWFEGSLAVMKPPDPAPDRLVFISVGGGYGVAQGLACALTEAGEAVCWGDRERRVERPDPPPGGYVAVSDGLGHTCALTTDGEAACWGWNNFGQVDVPPGSYTTISAGHRSTCAITEAGGGLCWGNGGPPWRFPALNRYVAIDAGWSGACALTDDGTPACRHASGSSQGPLAEAPPGPFVNISVGWAGHACALVESGETVCWGADSDGQVEVPPGRYRAIAAGDYPYSCALDESGAVACSNGAPMPAHSFEPGPYATIAAGWRYVCAITETGEAACRGSLDIDKSTNYGAADPPPGSYTAVTASMFRACALTEAGDVVCWGDVGYQQWPVHYLPGIYEIE